MNTGELHDANCECCCNSRRSLVFLLLLLFVAAAIDAVVVVAVVATAVVIGVVDAVVLLLFRLLPVTWWWWCCVSESPADPGRQKRRTDNAPQIAQRNKNNCPSKLRRPPSLLCSKQYIVGQGNPWPHNFVSFFGDVSICV